MADDSDSARATTRASTGATPRPRPTDYRESTPSSVFALLAAVRLLNALTVRTFFQPDEFFQSLEPAWQLAFGPTSNAWITWEWTTQLRSSLHPALFAAVYRATALLTTLCGVTLPARAELLIAAPKVTQAVSAALLDYYTWKLAEKAYSRGSRTAYATLALTLCNPWQWFCSTRTLSNCLETTTTSVAICYWPWHWQGTSNDSGPGAKGKSQIAHRDLGSLSELRRSLLLAAFACVLRPTNGLIWLSIAVPALWQTSKRRRYVLVREILFCGSAVLACSVASDKLYYGVWTLPPLRFLYFNIAQSLAVFYGRNRGDYYFTEGLPLLLTTALPFAVVGVWRALQGSPQGNPKIGGSNSDSPTAGQVESATQELILKQLSWTSIVVTAALSLISHKEVRFLYPILPFLLVLAAKPLTSFLPVNAAVSRKGTILVLLVSNILLAGYASQVHQRGVIDVLHYLRHKHEARHNLLTSQHELEHGPVSNTTVGFLMPCHSTPWRSHLVHAHIAAWALTCEPPLNVPLAERASYRDEADEFYLEPGPVAWLTSNMEDRRTIRATGSRSGQHWLQQDPKFRRKYLKSWPQNLVFFGQLEGELRGFLGDTRYRECWRGFNSHFHDDWRRVGDVVVWCLDE